MSDFYYETIKDFDFRPLGNAIKEARIARNLTREALAEEVGLSASHIANIENKPKCPGFQILYRLVTYFHISVDEFFYPEEDAGKTVANQVINMVKDCDTDGLYIVKGTLEAYSRTKKPKK